jgi:hypothetical protein
MAYKRLSFGIALILSMCAAVMSVVALVTPKPLISIAAGNTNAAKTSSSAMTNASDSKMSLMPFTYEYEAGIGLADTPGSGHVYELKLVGTPDTVLERVAKVFGVFGKPQKSSYWAPESPGYIIGKEDGSTPSVSIWWTGTGSWTYSNAWSSASAPCLRTEKNDDGTEYCAEYQEQKPTPELIPSKEAILKDAQRIFSATGLKVADSEISVYRDDWSASASASQKVAGTPTAITWSIGYDSKGNLSWASGNSVEAVDLGTYSTLSAKQAVPRLADWRWSGAPASSEYLEVQATASDQQIVGEKQKLTIEKAKQLLLQIWDKTGGSWLVPGYAMDATNGFRNFVSSLQDGVIELPDPMAIQPMIDDTVNQPVTK